MRTVFTADYFAQSFASVEKCANGSAAPSAGLCSFWDPMATRSALQVIEIGGGDMGTTICKPSRYNDSDIKSTKIIEQNTECVVILSHQVYPCVDPSGNLPEQVAMTFQPEGVMVSVLSSP